MDAKVPRRFQLSARAWIILAFLAAACAAGYVALQVHWVYTVLVPDAYAQEWATFLVIQHMEQNDGAWPSSWDSLAKPYEALTKEHGSFLAYAEIQDRVAIEFDADPEALRKMPLQPGRPPFKVIYLRSGAKHEWEGMEPNRMIWDYLNGLLRIENSDFRRDPLPQCLNS